MVQLIFAQSKHGKVLQTPVRSLLTVRIKETEDFYHGNASFHLWPASRRSVTRCRRSNRWSAQLSARCSPLFIRIGTVFFSGPLHRMAAVWGSYRSPDFKKLKRIMQPLSHVSLLFSHMFFKINIPYDEASTTRCRPGFNDDRCRSLENGKILKICGSACTYVRVIKGQCLVCLTSELVTRTYVIV